jgi:hypothetical protein
MADPLDGSVQQRIESSPLGRSVISGAILALFISLLSSNLPPSELRTQLSRVIEGARDALGLDQTWSVFAPEPRSQSLDLQARIKYTDGSTATWRLPKGNPFVGAYGDYRWRKYAEYVRQDDRRSLWAPFAIWLARKYDRPTKHPIDVTLIRLWQQNNPPGSSVLKEPWKSYSFFTLQVTPGMLVKP